MKLLPYQKRVVKEKKELDVKIAALEKFYKSAVYKGLGEAEKVRLTRQHGPMADYSAVLGQRIAAFKEGAV